MLDVAIGLSFVYLLLGLICTTVNEMIAGQLRTRAKFLDRGIQRLLEGTDLKSRLYKHPLIRSTVEDEKHTCPSYIAAQKFAVALLDIVSGAGKSHTDFAAVQQGIAGIPKDSNDKDPPFKTAFGTLLDASGGDPAALQKHVEDWYNDGMDRVTGWYKRNSQRNAQLIAIGLTLVMNADTARIAQTLWTNPTLRAAVVDQAQARSRQKPPEETLPMVSYDNPNDATASTPQNVPTSAEQALTANEQQLLGDLTGWAADKRALNKGDSPSLSDWLAALPGIVWLHGIGWILTAIAVSLGAPFWFDTLNRFVNIRNAGRVPDDKGDKGSPAPQGTPLLPPTAGTAAPPTSAPQANR